MANWDAIRFCRDFGIPYTLPGQSNSGKVTNGWIGIRCPNPRCAGGQKEDHGGFNLYGGYYSCWSCGGHQLPRVIRWLLKITEGETQEIIWNYTGTASVIGSIQRNKKKAGKVKEVILPGEALKRVHKDYLESRGFEAKYLIKKYNLKAIGHIGKTQLERKYKNRIIIPIYDRNGKLISYQGRDVTGAAKIKYKGCRIEDSVINYKHTLYGVQDAIDEQCALVEGVIDQWAMGDGFVCSFGTAVTEQQIRELSYFKRIFILFDPEPTAQMKAKKVAYRLSSINRHTEIIQMDSEVDPGDLEEDDIRYIRRELGFL